MILVTRQDLSCGYQSVQPAHALAQFATEHPHVFKEWQETHKNLVVLSVKDEQELKNLIESLYLEEIKMSMFREPDINNEITAIAVEPNEKAYKLTSHIPLALKNYGRDSVLREVEIL